MQIDVSLGAAASAAAPSSDPSCASAETGSASDLFAALLDEAAGTSRQSTPSGEADDDEDSLDEQAAWMMPSPWFMETIVPVAPKPLGGEGGPPASDAPAGDDSVARAGIPDAAGAAGEIVQNAIAGLPVQVGLYTAFVPMVVYALLGTSRPLSVSTTTTIAILTAAELGLAAPNGGAAELVTAAATLAILVGAMLVLASVLRLGFVANFISEPVLTGFKSGIGLVIVVDQIPKLLGVHIDKAGFFRDILAIFHYLPQTSVATLVLALVILALLLGLQVLVADRARLAADASWRPMIVSLCNMLGCSVPAWHQPGAIAMLSRDVSPIAGSAGGLNVQATFRNDARWPQPWPILLISLSDADGRVLGSRAFTPREYLDAAATQNELAPGQSAQIALKLYEPNPDVVAFSFDFR